MSMHHNWRRTLAVPVLVAAVAVVLGGTAGAASLITGAQIQDNTVQGWDVTNASVASADVKDRSVGVADYTGPVIGSRGPVGPVGPSGPAGISGTEYHVGPAVRLDPGTWSLPKATCPSGTKALSGGAATREDSAGTRILTSAPLDNGVGWQTAIRNEGTDWITVHAWVVCARA